MSYTITRYTRKKAQKLGVIVRPSTNPTKKIDVFKKKGVFKNNQKKISIGATGYGDYPTFMRTEGIVSANKHRKRYKIRHEKDRHQKGTPGFYADKLLW